ncbi:MAG: hypothetical protein IRZ16_16720, partial [Myxococcaceae bacterium]|nr:hypothetical protein [Myxococcaceae bacterium]
DGAQGLLEIHRRGGFTVAEDERSCAVYGMPREAVRLGAARLVLPLPEIAPALVREMHQDGSFTSGPISDPVSKEGP